MELSPLTSPVAWVKRPPSAHAAINMRIGDHGGRLIVRRCRLPDRTNCPRRRDDLVSGLFQFRLESRRIRPARSCGARPPVQVLVDGHRHKGRRSSTTARACRPATPTITAASFTEFCAAGAGAAADVSGEVCAECGPASQCRKLIAAVGHAIIWSSRPRASSAFVRNGYRSENGVTIRKRSLLKKCR